MWPMTAALEGGSAAPASAAPAAVSSAAAVSGLHGLPVAEGEGGRPLDPLLLLLLSSSLPMGEPVGVETPDCGFLWELGGVQAFSRPSPSGDCAGFACCACCSMKSSMNHLTLILYCFTVRSVPSSHGGYLSWYLLHNFFNCLLTHALKPFFSYLFSGCS